MTAANAAKAIFLRDAAIEFLDFTGKNNKLESDVYDKLHDLNELSHLKGDALKRD